MEGFQRTRGILRTFALGLRAAESWDESPLVGPAVFLCAPQKVEISEGARELTTVAMTESYEGRQQQWTAILEGELGKAAAIQEDFPSLKHRELEVAVLSTFLHSQPIGQRALTRDLMVLLGATRASKIEIEKALQKWADISWFLDEGMIGDAEVRGDGQKGLPKAWRLGSKPNLRQMHHDACARVAPELIESKLIDAVEKQKSLTAGVSAMGARVHNLPARPADIESDGEFHFAVLGPKAASDSGKPSAEAQRYLDETTGADRPRVNRNAVLLAVPSRDGLEAVRNQIRAYLGWEDVRDQLKDQDVDPTREQLLAISLEAARKAIPNSVRQAYCIVVTVSEQNEAQAFKLTVTDDNLFSTIKADKRSRIQETQISAEALLPGGPYALWKEGETSRRAEHLVGAFSQLPHLPKMLSRRAIEDTLADGCRQGLFVLKMTRPDRSVRTFWKVSPEETALKDPSLEVVLPEVAELTEVPTALLLSDALPGFWTGDAITVDHCMKYFAGGHVVKVKREGYEEPVVIPKASPELVKAALGRAVAEGRLWLLSGPASLWGEEVPEGLLSEDALLLAPPKPIATTDLLPANLPDGWSGQETTAQLLYVALSKKAGRSLPWKTVQTAIEGALRARFLEKAGDSGEWPCEYGSAGKAKFGQPGTPPPPPPPPPTPGSRVAEAELQAGEIQDLAEAMGELKKAAAGHPLRIQIRLQLGDDKPVPADVAEKVEEVLKKVSAKLGMRG